MTSELIRIATRKSPLALWQAEFVKHQLVSHYPECQVELVTMTTRGDTWLDTPLAKIGGKGLFVKELEQALLDGQADIAVHSMKDVPMAFPKGLGLAVICERENPSDALVSHKFQSLSELPAGSRVGTSSLRRQCQIRSRFADLEISDLRGNVNTRLTKLDNGEYDAIILASAGLIRLGLDKRISCQLPFDECLPAGGQGAVGIETRVDDERVNTLLKPLHHQATATCVSAERAMNRRLEGGCQVPIACFAEIIAEKQLWLRGLVGSVDGSCILKRDLTGPIGEPEHLGVQLAELLLADGAGEILNDVYRQA